MYALFSLTHNQQPLIFTNWPGQYLGRSRDGCLVQTRLPLFLVLVIEPPQKVVLHNRFVEASKKSKCKLWSWGFIGSLVYLTIDVTPPPPPQQPSNRYQDYCLTTHQCIFPFRLIPAQTNRHQRNDAPETIDPLAEGKTPSRSREPECHNPCSRPCVAGGKGSIDSPTRTISSDIESRFPNKSFRPIECRGAFGKCEFPMGNHPVDENAIEEVEFSSLSPVE